MTKHIKIKNLLVNIALVCISLSLSVGLFLGADRIYTDYILNPKYLNPVDLCVIPHKERHHAFKANCEEIDVWGPIEYKISTNNLAIKDEKVRNVPPTSDKPRILFLGDSFTEGRTWPDTFAGRFAIDFPQYDVLNGGLGSYSPSNYYILAHHLLQQGLKFDEAIVFIDISDIQDEASYYVDTGTYSVDARNKYDHKQKDYTTFRYKIKHHWKLTDLIYSFFERWLVKFGILYLPSGGEDDIFDAHRSAWTYRGEMDHILMPDGYAPLGIEGGIQKAKYKMDLLYQMLKSYNIPLSVVVYPWPGQLKHDSVNSKQVTIWQDWCQGKCKRFINAFPEFFAEKDKCNKLLPGCWYEKFFIFSDIHYNTNGNRIISTKLAKEFKLVPIKKIN